MSERIEADITIVGAGIAGLWSAKELIDRGLSVNIVEKSDTLADGATTRNEGWLHAGTYHAVGIENEAEIAPVTSGIRWSHEAIVGFAPESIDHGPTFAVVASDDLAHKAVNRWEQTGVGYREVFKDAIGDSEYIDTERLRAIFNVEDKSINTRVLCQKLAHYVLKRGARIFTEATFVPESDTAAEVDVRGGDRYTLSSSRFLITTGAGIKDIVEEVTGRELTTRFFKAHLLVLPRLTTDNYFHLEAGESGFMNHGNASVVAVNRDGIELAAPDYSVVREKEQLAYASLVRMVPSAQRHELGGKITAVVCNKPDVTGGFGDTQSLDVKIFEPSPNYICALPGKMTMAPYLASRVANLLTAGIPKLASPPVQSNTPERFTNEVVTLRPADRWMQQQA